MQRHRSQTKEIRNRHAEDVGETVGEEERRMGASVLDVHNGMASDSDAG